MRKITILLLVFIFAFALTFLLGASGCEKKAETDEATTVGTEELSTKDEYANVIEEDEEITKDKRDFNWSTMDGGPYKDEISYATSTDLLNWTDSEEILAKHVSVPGAIIKDGVISVYFVDVSENGIPEQIGLLKSSDNGKTWADKQIIAIEGVGNRVPVDPAPFLMDDGRVRLYYFNINTEQEPGSIFKIYSAISKDGVNFTQEPGVRFAGAETLDPDVIKVGDTWRMYLGRGTDGAVVSAVSKDGLTFEEEGIALKNAAVPDVFYKDGTYYLFTARIDIATSKDGLSFTSTGNSFESKVGMMTADPSVIELDDGTYMMFYKTSQEMPGGGPGSGPGPGQEPGGEPGPPPPQ